MPPPRLRGARGCLLTVAVALLSTTSLVDAQIVTSQGVTTASSPSTQTVNATVSEADGGVTPVILQVDQGWDIDLSSVSGTLSLDGIAAGTEPGAVVYIETKGETSTDPCFCAEGLDAGSIGLVSTAAITATDVAGAEGGAGGLFVVSHGADGYPSVEFSSPASTLNNAPFDGTTGGDIAVTLAGGSIDVNGTGTGTDVDALDPTLIGLSAVSQGGAGSSGYYNSGGLDQNPVPFYGDGGDGGSITVGTAPQSSIAVTQTGAGSNAVGIYALSQGSTPGQFYGEISDNQVNYVGTGGDSGPVRVLHGGEITVDAPQGFGIYAAAIGGNGDTSNVSPANPGGGMPGDGGDVTVRVARTGTIDMIDGGVGILALSHAGTWYPAGSTAQPEGGTVRVSIAEGAIISTGSGADGASTPFSFGILALSSGTPLVAERNYADTSGTGVGGAVTVVNGGSIETNGELAIGIAAISTGGVPIIGSVDQGTNVLGNSGSTGGATGGSVTVDNRGTIRTLGASASGVLAVSAGGGGIIDNDAQAVASNGVWTAGTSVGGDTGSSDPATNGGVVTVTNSGKITTGDGEGGGIAALGIIAQSIGGSGGSAGGSESLTNLGDTGGGGGAGGTVTVTLADGSEVLTMDDNAHAILAQSIGGGGGNGANEAGGFVATGGAGGAGGDGSSVTLSSTGPGSFGTLGNYSSGALVQSIGGGGGSGGYANTAGAFISDAIGGAGGAGGNGGASSASNGAGSAVTTQGNQSGGLVVQSIGGGGGMGGSATSYSAGILFDVSTALGGQGGAGGAGGAASATNAGTIDTGLAPGSLQTSTFQENTGVLYGSLSDGTTITQANFSTGSLAEGQLSGSFATVTLSDGTVIENATISGTVLTGTTSGGQSYSATLSSGGIHYAVAENASSDVVTGLLMPDGSINTVLPGPNPNGADSPGIVVQSIGGGGGSGGSASAKSLVLPLPGAKQAGVTLPTMSFTTALGGLGGSGNDGGTAEATNTGSVTTYGDASTGILVQSIGGGGGNGGDATAASTAIQSAGVDFQLTIGNGGAGGAGASGGTVTVDNGTSSGGRGTIATFGQNAAGILAQSIGGGGGNGGIGNAGGSTPPVHYSTGKSFAPTISVGGSGASGGDGGIVKVTNSSDSLITTFGSTSSAIVAQSIGGGGGNAGGGTASGTGDTVDLNVAVGGSGAIGGEGNDVAVQNDGIIRTEGGASIGILAQSIGGGGGSGGTSDAYASATVSVNDVAGGIQNIATGTPFYTATLTIGGSGGAGGNGGEVGVLNTSGSIDGDHWTAGIETAGAQSYGILAQSIGGGGGLGGTATGDTRSALVSEATGVPPQATISIASDGGQSGYGRLVMVENQGVVVTHGFGAHAVIGRGIGGGGGFGSDGSVDSNVAISLGANITDGILAEAGEPGLTIPTVTVTNDIGAGIMTTGRGAAAIVAQSVGGGGGVASSGFDGFETIGGGQAGTATHDFNLGGGSAVVFGTGGIPVDPPPNFGANVEVNHYGEIVTEGDWSSGIIAQSIGSGGGIAYAYATDSVDAEISMFVGSTVDALGAGGDVAVNLGSSGAPSTIVTGAPVIGSDGTVTHSGYSSYGILAQSIADGGGLAMDDSASVSDPCAGSSDANCRAMTVGGFGYDNGGNVTLQGDAVIKTYGDGAHAVVLQSIGGGGGIGGQGRTLTDEDPAPTETLSLQLGYLQKPSNGVGGAVTIENSVLDIRTEGDNAYGVLAQSIGGGGGLVFAQSASTATISVQENSAYPGGGEGGDVTITLDEGSSIETHGVGAIGILAQSIGYGGGVAGYLSGTDDFTIGTAYDFNLVVDLAGGDGGIVSINVDADILTTGALAHGILAQSMGSGGGLIQNGSSQLLAMNETLGQDATVTITQAGTIFTTGEDSTGIIAQSNGVNQPIQVTVNGIVGGGSSGGYGIWIDGGVLSDSEQNIIEVAEGAWVTSLSGNAINLTNGVGAIYNYGSVAGDVVALDGTYFFNYGTYYTNGIDPNEVPDWFFNVGGTVGISPSYQGGPTALTTPLTVDVPVLYQVDTGSTFSILTENTYTSDTALAGGVVIVNNDQPFGTGTVTVVNPTATIETTSETQITLGNEFDLLAQLTLTTADSNSQIELSNLISGTGGITADGPGTVILTWDNTYMGPTHVAGGTLVAGGAQAFGTGAMIVDEGATLDVNAFELAFASLSGDGLVTSQSGGSQSLTIGNGTGTRSEFGGTIDDTIGAVTFDSGIAILTGANAYTGGTTMTGGPTAIVLGNDRALSTGPVTVNSTYAYFSTTGDMPITIANDIALIQSLAVSIAEDDPELTLAGAITGAGAFYKRGAGVATLAGSSDYSGNTYIAEGVLRAGSTTGLSSASDFVISEGGVLDLNGYDSSIGGLSGAGLVTNTVEGETASLSVGATGTTTLFTGDIGSGLGDLSLRKIGEGMLVLAGENVYGGGTLIEEGTLGVASLTALGTGDVTNNSVLASIQLPEPDSSTALLASEPGDTSLLAAAPPATGITIMGDYTQSDDATLVLNVFDGGEGHDLFTVGGAATLDGDIKLNIIGPIVPANRSIDPLIFNGDVTGAFDTVYTSYPTVLADFQGDGFVLSQGSFAELATADYSKPERIVAAYIDAHDKGSMSDEFAQIVGELNALSPNAKSLEQSFSRFHSGAFTSFVRDSVFNNSSFQSRQIANYLHGRIDGAGFSPGGQVDTRRLALFDPSIPLDEPSGPSAGAMPSLRKDVSVYVQGNVIFGHNDGARRWDATDTTTSSVTIGGDTRVSPNALIGAFLRYSHARSDLDEANSQAEMDVYEPGLYAAFADHGWYASAVASYGFNDFSQSRHIGFDADNDVAKSDPQGAQQSASLQGGYDFQVAGWTVGPAAGLQYVRFDLNSFKEKGAPGLDLSVKDQTADSLRSRFGVRSFRDFTLGEIQMRAVFGVDWQHEYLDTNGSVTAQFRSVGDGSFTIDTPKAGRDAVVLDFGLDGAIADWGVAFANYTAMVGDGSYVGQSIQAGLQVGF
ncbi:autotransporter-associated beta strand protein [Rhodoligotrophos appendicifer]|uniref:autotransporter-associated beta strand repeat-containing protein n=1 Tax=Rhodoligotrophos appendicifer TaxID=987056 RepID=UPI001185451A|nr:autotransporter-associated beta strand repeat-containing protein [Rhodoligotrophos appendicifer]